MDRFQDVADKTDRLAAYVRNRRGSSWTVTTAQGTQDMCIRLERAATVTMAKEGLVEFCGNTFDDAEAKLRQYLTSETGGEPTIGI
jgi:hypothetical protein